jgi:hypothetical protein
MAAYATGGTRASAPSAPPAPAGTPLVPASNPIVAENDRPGNADWVINGPVSSDTLNQIKGYADHVSVNVGGTIDFKVTVNPPQSFTIRVYRLGWYSGAGGRLLAAAGPLSGITQPACPTDPTTRLIACSWSSSYSLTVGADWVSGEYLAKLQNAQGYQN